MEEFHLIKKKICIVEEFPEIKNAHLYLFKIPERYEFSNLDQSIYTYINKCLLEELRSNEYRKIVMVVVKYPQVLVRIDYADPSKKTSSKDLYNKWLNQQKGSFTMCIIYTGTQTMFLVDVELKIR